MTRREKREGETKGQRGRERESERVIEREREKERGKRDAISKQSVPFYFYYIPLSFHLARS